MITRKNGSQRKLRNLCNNITMVIRWRGRGGKEGRFDASIAMQLTQRQQQQRHRRRKMTQIHPESIPGRSTRKWIVLEEVGEWEGAWLGVKANTHLDFELRQALPVSAARWRGRRRVRRQFQTVEEARRRPVRPPVRPLLTVGYNFVALLSVFGRSHLLMG